MRLAGARSGGYPRDRPGFIASCGGWRLSWPHRGRFRRSEQKRAGTTNRAIYLLGLARAGDWLGPLVSALDPRRIWRIRDNHVVELSRFHAAEPSPNLIEEEAGCLEPLDRDDLR